MTLYRDIQLKREHREARKQDKLPFKRAVLTTEGGLQTSSDPLNDVWASITERRVWHMTDGAVQPGQILCRKVSDPYVGLGVIIGYADGSNQLEVLSDDFFLTGTGDPTSWASTAPRDFEPGGRKQMWVYTKVITPLATYPGSGISANVIGGDYPYLGTRKTFAGSVNFALTSNPNPGEHYLAGLYLDAANTLQVVYGASVIVATTPSEPTWPAGAFRLSAVRINDTQTSIDFADDVFDRRMAWSDEIAGSDGWPFSKERTIDPTDIDADDATITDAITNATAGFLLEAGVATYNEAVTINKNVTLQGRNAGRLFITQPLAITALGAELMTVWVYVDGSGTQAVSASVTTTLTNVRTNHSGVADAKAIVCSTATMTLRGVIATSSGSTTSRVLEVTGGTALVDESCDFDAGGAGTRADVYCSGGTVRLNGPILRNGIITNTGGTVTGWYRDATGNVYTIDTTGQSSGVWLIDESATLKIKEATLAAAVAAAASGDSIKLDTDTYTFSSMINIGVSLTVEGDGPEATIIDFTGSNQAAFDFTTDSTTIILRNLTLKNTGGGTGGTGIFSNNAVNVILDNAQVLVPSGSPTDARALWIEGGTWELRNGAKAKSTSGTGQYGIYNDVGAATITIGPGCEVGGTTADIYGDQSGSTLTNFGLLTNGIVNFAGINARANIQVAPTEPIIINGHPLVWQRGTSFATAADGTYFADRFIYLKSGAMVHTLSQSSDVPTITQIGAKFNYSMLADCTTVDAAIAAGDYAAIRYIIEGYDFLKIAQQQFTLPFWVKATKVGIYCIAFRNSGSDRSYVVEYTVNTTDTWEYKQVTVTASPSAGTWDYTTGIGLSITWALAAGSTFQAAASGDWETGNFFGTANQVNACDDTANNFRLIVGDPIPGAYARPIVPNPFGDYESLLARCYRYCYIVNAGANNINEFIGAKFSTTVVSLNRFPPVVMRAAPALTHNITGYTGGAPGTTTVALIDFGAGGFATITGALTVSANCSPDALNVALTAGTSWSGTAGNVFALRLGPSVVMAFAPSDYS